MLILFGYSNDLEKTDAVYWVEDGSVMERILRSDGTSRQKRLEFPMLKDAVRQMSGVGNTMRYAEVKDLRTAFMYLGKSADLTDLLPEVYPSADRDNKQAS